MWNLLRMYSVDFWLLMVQMPILSFCSLSALSVTIVPGNNAVVFAASSSNCSAIWRALSRVLLNVLCGLLLFLR